jgi:hypothetical protein
VGHTVRMRVFLWHSCTDFAVIVASSSLIHFPQPPLLGDAFVCTHVLGSTCHCLKTTLRNQGWEPTSEQAQGVSVGQWCQDGIGLRYVGMHYVLHSQGMRASTIAQVVVMG